MTLLQSVASPSLRGSKLEAFRSAFVDRYGSREVPLGEALDAESGIGYGVLDEAQADGSPLLAGLGFGGAAEGERGRWGARYQLLLKKLVTALQHGAREVALDDADWAALRNPDPQPLPDAFAVVTTLLARDAAACDRGEFRVLVDAAPGPSGATLLGRFCHGDARLAAAVAAHLRAEEALRPDVVFAEIVHLPEERIGNLLQRPLVREHEIPFLGSSGAPPDKQIPIADLSVSVVGERVVLRSQRLDREVVPRLSTAHNFADAKNLAVYQFLCALQFQNMGSLGFGWGPLESAPYLPRLVSGRWIIARARWRLEAEEIDALDHDTAAGRFLAVLSLRQSRDLPRRVAILDDDQALQLDLDNALFVDAFIELARRKRRALLVEVLDEELCASGPDGAFMHELIVPFVRARPATARPARPRHHVPPSQRSLGIGSSCLYAKLYCGPATADRVLGETLGPFGSAVVGDGISDGWFFIRYGDPDWHVRLRFFGDGDVLVRELLPRLAAVTQPLVERGLVWRHQLDTYDREIERYGGLDGTRLAEQIFCADSDAVIALLTLPQVADDPDARWRLALLGIDRLLDDLGLDLAAKHALMSEARARLVRLLGAKPTLERTLGARYRGERLGLEALLTADESHPLATGLEVLAGRSQRIRPLAAELARLGRAGALSVNRSELAGSYVHMFANRLFRAAAQQQELVIYDFLGRLYESQRARRKATTLVSAQLAT
jgi:thiopeptide-type bacteriocin biosynthesis protein